MHHTNILRNYKLSQYTVERLKIIKEKLKDDILKGDPSWTIIIKKEMVKEKEEEQEMEEEEKEEEEEEEEEEENEDRFKEAIVDKEELLIRSNFDNNDSLSNTVNEFLSTQFYFTQVEKNCDKEIKQESKQRKTQKFDITEYLLEGLEHPNGKLDLSHLENLTDKELLEVIGNLEKELSMLGTYNLCCSLNNMTIEQQIKYTTIFYSHLLLPKIIALEEPSRLLISVISECVKKFPNDIEQLIFIPLLNVDLKDTTIVNAIINAFEPERNSTLITEYLSHVKEIKSWHLPILYSLISVKTDIAINDKLIQLFSEKAFQFAKHKDFGKLILLFIKVNINFSKHQKHLLQEITDTHQTFFKKPIQNILNTM